MMVRTPSRGALVLFTLAGMAACSSSGAPSGPDVIVGPHTKVLDAASLDALASTSPDGATLAFSSSTPLLASIGANDVLVAPVSAKTPQGFLRRVDAVSGSNGAVTLITHPARLTDAFERARITFHKDLSAGDLKPALRRPALRAQDGANAGAALTIGLNNEVLFDADGKPETTDDQVRVSGNVSLHPSVDLNIDIEGFALKTATVALTGAESASLDVVVEGAYSFDESQEATAFELTPITIPVGEVPLVFVPSISIKYGVKGTLGGSFEMGASENASFSAGVGYANGAWGPTTNATFDAQLNPPQIDGKLALRAFAGPQLNVLLYGVSGPYIGLSGYLALDGDIHANPCWNLHGGVDASLGVRANPIDDTGDYATTLNVVDKSIVNGPCGAAPPPDTFWSKTYSSASFSPEDTSLVPTVDGGFVVVAKSADLVLKIDVKGNVVWQRQFTNFHDVRSVVVLADGTYVVAGASAGGWVARLDAGGAFLWSKVYTAPGTAFEIAKIVATRDGGFFVTGIATGASGDADVWAMKTDASGAPQWSKRVGAASSPDGGEDARETADGHLVITGTGATGLGIAMSLGSDGALAWQKQYGNGATTQSLHTLAPSPNGGWLLGGTIQEGPATHGWLLRVGGDGALQNGPYGSVQYLPSDPSAAFFQQIEVRALAASVDAPDTYFGVGTIWDGVSTTTRTLWAFEVALSSDGTANVIWSRSFDAAGDDEGYAMGQLTDKTLVIGGTSQTLGLNPTGNLWLSRTQQNGAIAFAPSSGVTVASLSGQIYQTTSVEPPDGGPVPVPVLVSDASLTSADLPVTAAEDSLMLLDTSLTVRALAP